MDNSYWLGRVINKLNISFLNGTVMSQWVPDKENPDAESRALDVLEIADVIKSPGGYEGAPKEYQYRIVDIRGGFARSSPQRRIVDFDYDKFIRFCETHDINPTAKGIPAQLEVVDEVQPVITIERARYTLRSLDSGRLPQEIIAYAWKNPDRRIPLDEFRQHISMVQLHKDDATITQILDKKNIFGKNGILHAFAELEVRSLLLKRDALLTPSEIATIKKASAN